MVVPVFVKPGFLSALDLIIIWFLKGLEKGAVRYLW